MSDQPVWHSESATTNYKGLRLSVWARANGLKGFQWEVFSLREDAEIQACLKHGDRPTTDGAKEAARKWVDGE